MLQIEPSLLLTDNAYRLYLNCSVLANVNVELSMEVELVVIYWSAKPTTGEIHVQDVLVCIFGLYYNHM